MVVTEVDTTGCTVGTRDIGVVVREWEDMVVTEVDTTGCTVGTTAIRPRTRSRLVPTVVTLACGRTCSLQWRPSWDLSSVDLLSNVSSFDWIAPATSMDQLGKRISISRSTMA